VLSASKEAFEKRDTKKERLKKNQPRAKTAIVTPTQETLQGIRSEVSALVRGLRRRGSSGITRIIAPIRKIFSKQAICRGVGRGKF